MWYIIIITDIVGMWYIIINVIAFLRADMNLLMILHVILL